MRVRIRARECYDETAFPYWTFFHKARIEQRRRITSLASTE
jgi:hypothetical protein